MSCNKPSILCKNVEDNNKLTTFDVVMAILFLVVYSAMTALCIWFLMGNSLQDVLR